MDAQKFAKLGSDGVVAVGTKVTKGSPLVCVYNEASGGHRFESHKSTEPAVVDEVRVGASCVRACVRVSVSACVSACVRVSVSE